MLSASTTSTMRRLGGLSRFGGPARRMAPPPDESEINEEPISTRRYDAQLNLTVTALPPLSITPPRPPIETAEAGPSRRHSPHTHERHRVELQSNTDQRSKSPPGPMEIHTNDRPTYQHAYRGEQRPAPVPPRRPHAPDPPIVTQSLHANDGSHHRSDQYHERQAGGSGGLVTHTAPVPHPVPQVRVDATQGGKRFFTVRAGIDRPELDS
jgi:hypothetical protein